VRTESSTSPAAAPVAVAASDTPVTCRDTSEVPLDACCTLRAISRVAALCCSTAAAIAAAIWLTRSMVPPIAWIARTEEVVAAWIAVTWPVMSSGLGGLACEILHLGGDDGKALAGFARARRLDRGVERGQVGLACDAADQFDDIADALGRVRQRLDVGVGAMGLGRRRACDAGGFGDLPADLADRCRQLFGRGRDRLDIGGGLLGDVGHHDRFGAALLGGRGHRVRGGIEFA
jgi:hypothetical protein